MKDLRSIGLWMGSCVLAVAAPGAIAQMQQMPCTSPSCSADPMGMPAGRSGRQQMPQQQLPPIAPERLPNDGRIEHDQAKLRNADRQRQIIADTQKLVELANQLNAAVEKSNKDMLSLDVVRKADEIEKLAKSVREKMKGS